MTLPAPEEHGQKRREGKREAVDEEEKKDQGAPKDSRREGEGARSPESGPMGTDHEHGDSGPMGTEDKHEEEAESRVGEEED